MADSLDDFFAKKDKKRGKDKGKTVFSAEALVKELEEGSKQSEYPVRKENKTSTAIELLGLDADDADWRDFEDVEKRDYTGLKVKEMSLQDQTEEEQRRLSSDQSEPVPDSSVWKMKDDQPASATAEPTSNAKQQGTTISNVIGGSIDKAVQDSTKSSDTKAVSSSTDQQTATLAEEQKVDGKTSQEGGSEQAIGEKKGDKPSAKPAAYRPPAERMMERNVASGEVKVLEPIRLSKTKTTGSGRQGPMLDMADEKMFPSLG